MGDFIYRLGPGLLEEHLAPLSSRIDELIRHRRLQLGELPRRERLLGGAGRPPGSAFQVVASAILERRQLAFRYHSRSRDQPTERQVSPQRLVHYRDNWYLDAWDPKSKDLRTFSVDRIGHARVLEATACDIPDAELDQHFGDLRVPYRDARELIMEILRHGRDVEVIEPAELRRWVTEALWAALSVYAAGGPGEA